MAKWYDEEPEDDDIVYTTPANTALARELRNRGIDVKPYRPTGQYQQDKAAEEIIYENQRREREYNTQRARYSTNSAWGSQGDPKPEPTYRRVTEQQYWGNYSPAPRSGYNATWQAATQSQIQQPKPTWGDYVNRWRRGDKPGVNVEPMGDTYPLDMDGTTFYTRQLGQGRDEAEVHEELRDRAMKRAETLGGGMGTYTPVVQYLTEGERALYEGRLPNYTMNQRFADNLSGVWKQTGNRIMRAWGTLPQSGRGNFFDPADESYQQAIELYDAARTENAKVYARAQELRTDWIKKNSRSTSPFVQGPPMVEWEGELVRADLVPLQSFVAQAEREMEQRIVTPTAVPGLIYAENVRRNIQQVPVTGQTFSVLGNTLLTAFNTVEGVGKSIWSVPISRDGVAVDEKTGLYKWDGDIVTIGELASAATYATTQLAEVAWEVPPWQYTGEVNPIARWRQAFPEYVDRIVDSVYSVAPKPYEPYDPSDPGTQALLEARSLTSGILAFSGVEDQEQAISDMLSLEQRTAEAEQRYKEALAASEDYSLDPDKRAEAALYAAQFYNQWQELVNTDKYDIIEANIDPWRDALLSVATDFSLMGDALKLMGLAIPGFDPFNLRLSNVERAVDRTEQAIAKSIERTGLPTKAIDQALRITRPPVSNVMVEVRDARALFAYVLQGVTVKSDVPKILEALADDPVKFFTEGIPASKILSPALKTQIEGGYIKFPHVQATQAAKTGALATIKSLSGQFDQLASINVPENLSLMDVIDELTTGVLVKSGEKYKASRLPFEMPLGTSRAEAGNYINKADGKPVHVVEFKNDQGVVLSRKIVPSQQVAENAANQVNRALRTEGFTKVDPLNRYVNLQRTAASLAYLASVPGSWITNALGGWLNTFFTGVQTFTPMDTILSRAEQLFGQVPYDYLIRGSEDMFFIPNAGTEWIKKLRGIRGGQTTLPGTGGRVAFGENAMKARAWWGGFTRTFKRLSTSLYRNEVLPILREAGFDPTDARMVEAAFRRFGASQDLDALNQEIGSMFSRRTPTFNPSRYGAGYDGLLDEKTIQRINGNLASGKDVEYVARAISAEIGKITKKIGAETTATQVINVAQEFREDVRNLTNLASDARVAGDIEQSAIATTTARVIDESRNRIISGFNAALVSGNAENAGALMAQMWGRLEAAKRNAYSRLDDLAGDIIASGDRTRWGGEYRAEKLAVWQEFADEAMRLANEALTAIARGDMPAESVADDLISRSLREDPPDISSPGNRPRKGRALQDIIERHREYKLYYMRQFFAEAARFGDTRALNVFLTTFNDVARYEDALWSRIDALQAAVDAATGAAKQQAIIEYRTFKAREHYNFSVWAGAKWRAATAYLQYAGDRLGPLATYRHDTLGAVEVIGLGENGEVVVRTVGDGRRVTVPVSTVPPSIVEMARKRIDYLRDLDRRIQTQGYIDPVAEPRPRIEGIATPQPRAARRSAQRVVEQSADAVPAQAVDEVADAAEVSDEPRATSEISDLARENQAVLDAWNAVVSGTRAQIPPIQELVERVQQGLNALPKRHMDKFIGQEIMGIVIRGHDELNEIVRRFGDTMPDVAEEMTQARGRLADLLRQRVDMLDAVDQAEEAIPEEVARMANDMVPEVAHAMNLTEEVPTVQSAWNDQIDRLRTLRQAVLDDPGMLSPGKSMSPDQLGALGKIGQIARRKHRQMLEAASVMGHKMADFNLIDTTGATWFDTMLSIPFPFHTFQTRTWRRLMERIFTQPSVRHALDTEAELFEYANGEANKEYVTVEIGGQEYRVYTGFGKYMMNATDYANTFRYAQDEGGFLSSVVAAGGSIATSPYPWIDAAYRYQMGLKPYVKGYLPQSRLLFNAGQMMAGASTPAMLLEDRDIGYVTNELSRMVEQGEITEAESQYAAAYLHSKMTGKPLPEFVAKESGNAASILDTAMRRVGERGTVASLSQYFLGVTVAPRDEGQDKVYDLGTEYRSLGIEENPAGGRTAQNLFLERNPELAVYWMRYQVQDPGSESPAITAKRQEYYDKADVIYADMAQAVIAKLHETPTAKRKVINDIKGEYYDQIAELKKEYEEFLDVEFETNTDRMNPTERAVYELEAILKYDGEEPPYPAEDATAEEKVKAYEDRAAWNEARLTYIEQEIKTLGGEEAWEKKLKEIATDQYASELLRKYEDLKYASAIEKQWSDRSSVIEERRGAEWDARYAAVESRLGADTRKAVAVYQQLDGDERSEFRDANPEISVALTAMYDPSGYDGALAKFGSDAWETYVAYKSGMPEYPGQDASSAAKARYYDELAKHNQRYEDGYEIRMWVDGRYRWWYELDGQYDDSHKFGGDYEEAIRLFGPDIFDKYTSRDGYKLREVQAFNEWRNEFQDRPAGAQPPAAQSENPFLKETEESYDPNEFFSDYAGPRPVGSEREPVLSSDYGKWMAAIKEWTSQRTVTPQSFWQMWQATADDPAGRKALLDSHPQYAKAAATLVKRVIPYKMSFVVATPQRKTMS